MARHGEEALDYLFRRGEYRDAERSPRPRLILLDLRLPRVDGLEVLGEIKSSPDLRAIPTVVLTTSESEHDVARACAQHANSYLVKPVEFDALRGAHRQPRVLLAEPEPAAGRRRAPGGLTG